MPTLTALKVVKAAYPVGRKGPFLISDGQGLYLQVMPSGTKSWVLRFMLNSRSRAMGLGSFGDGPDRVSLAGAREAAAKARALLKKGIDPIEARDLASKAAQVAVEAAHARSTTFRDVALEYVRTHDVSWKNPKHRAQWVSTLETYAFPVLGELPAAEVDAEAVERVLKPIWLGINETASRLRGRIEAILDYAKATGRRTGDNPARWKESLKYRLPNVSRLKRTQHHPALPWQSVPAFLEALQSKSGTAAKALIFCILTATRSGEVRGAVWREIDMEKGIWTIPAERMKGGREHRVPLSEAAVEILRQVFPLASGSDDFVFQSTRGGKMLSDMALSELVRGMNEGTPSGWRAADGRRVVVHGFRSTFRDWCEEATSTPRAVSEAALAHVIENKVEAAYHRTDHFAKRRVLMEKWGEFCLSGEPNRGLERST